jgi:hypothetical protein
MEEERNAQKLKKKAKITKLYVLVRYNTINDL